MLCILSRNCSHINAFGFSIIWIIWIIGENTVITVTTLQISTLILNLIFYENYCINFHIKPDYASPGRMVCWAQEFYRHSCRKWRNFSWYFCARTYNGVWFRWTQSLEWISDDELDEAIDDKGGGDSPSDEEVLVSRTDILDFFNY